MNELENQVASALGIEQEPVAAEEGAQEVAAQEPQQAEEVQPQEPAPAQEASSNNSTIRQMRDQISSQKEENSRLQNLLQRVADERGVSIEQLEADIQAKEDKRRAEAMSVPPEVAKQIRLQEERIKQLEEQATMDDLMHRVDNFKHTTGLNDQQTIDFLKDAQTRGFDPVRRGTDLVTLYRAINFDRLSQAKEAEIRQQILNDMQRQREQGNAISNPSPIANPSDTPDEISDAEFIKQLKKNLKE